MAHSQLVIGADGWNGWGVHVSVSNLPIGTQLQPLALRHQPNSAAMQVYGMVYPLTGPATITAYWLNVVQHQPEAHKPAFGVWLLEAALETVRQQHFPALPSRLHSVFAFRCGAEAIRFACHHLTEQKMAYLFEFQPAPGTVMVDMQIWDGFGFDYLLPDEAFNGSLAMAEAYWQSATTDLTAQGLSRPELLVPAPVVLIEPAIGFDRDR